MQLVFWPKDSIYKIFTTLDKLRPNQTISLIINHRNEIYQQKRRGKQIKALLESKKINYEIWCKHHQVKDYCQEVWLNYVFHGQVRYVTLAHQVYDFLFRAKDFHLNLLTQDRYTLYMIWALELCLLILIWYGIRYLLWPSATITIRPNYLIEDIVYNFRYVPASSYPDYQNADYISIPYYTGLHQTTMSHSRRKKDQIDQSSAGTIRITNEMAISYTIKPGTRFVTQDEIVLRTSKRVTIPPATSDGPWVISNITLKADLLDEQGKLIWSRANIKSGTNLLIKNLKPSFFLKKVIAQAEVPFSWWDIINEFYLTSGDIQNFKTDATNTLYQQKQAILAKEFNSISIIPFKYNDLISAYITQRDIKQQIWDKVKFINGDVIAKLWYKYIVKDDLQKAIQKYLSQRPVQYYDLVDINMKDLVFYNTINIDYTGKTLSIPTKISVIKWYNFEDDPQKIIQSIKDAVVSKDLIQAKSILTQYDKRGVGEISISPNRYNTLPATKSRIYIDIKK